MTYYITLSNFRTWLNRAQCALVSKNKVRKDLWTDFCDILFFDNPDNQQVIKISQSHYTSISTFLQTEGRSDSLKDDSILNWVTTLHDLRRQLNDEVHYATRSREITFPESPVRKYVVSTSEQLLPQQTQSVPATTSSLTSVQTHEDPLRRSTT